MRASCSPKKRKGASVHKRGELIHGKGERGFCRTSAMAQLEDLNGVVLGHGGRDDAVSGRRNKDVVSAAGIVSGLVVSDSEAPLKSNGGSLSLPAKAISLALLLIMERDAL
ncbi:hypothetical protein D8674_019304 [Pyrus ussuriensis x Pyrus communis]|uniref:Uncharacterized protein n=1 Tax=Pyrus ussuriensis x Pyrus communis TaxID=2448454 RepID=A0A5N5GCU1_9ROSA|nr:hypothetical protein D8674_019304 [Pyrus ussuriensis x Pyrus communis]